MKWKHEQELQLWTGGEGTGIRRPEKPGDSCRGPNNSLQDGAVVLDDGAEAKAIMPRRHGRAICSYKGRHRSKPNSRIWTGHQHHQWWARVWDCQ